MADTLRVAALEKALHYHTTRPSQTPEEVVETAKKFYAFLSEGKNG